MFNKITAVYRSLHYRSLALHKYYKRQKNHFILTYYRVEILKKVRGIRPDWLTPYILVEKNSVTQYFQHFVTINQRIDKSKYIFG